MSRALAGIQRAESALSTSILRTNKRWRPPHDDSKACDKHQRSRVDKGGAPHHLSSISRALAAKISRGLPWSCLQWSSRRSARRSARRSDALGARQARRRHRFETDPGRKLTFRAPRGAGGSWGGQPPHAPGPKPRPWALCHAASWSQRTCAPAYVAHDSDSTAIHAIGLLPTGCKSPRVSAIFCSRTNCCKGGFEGTAPTAIMLATASKLYIVVACGRYHT